MSDSNTTNVAGVPVSTAHFIDGKRVASKYTFERRSPIDRSHLADVSAAGSEEIDAAVAAARRAFPAWAALGPERRLPNFEPTMLTPIEQKMEIVQSEVFLVRSSHGRPSPARRRSCNWPTGRGMVSRL